jgi:hypothetical protein
LEYCTPQGPFNCGCSASSLIWSNIFCFFFFGGKEK